MFSFGWRLETKLSTSLPILGSLGTPPYCKLPGIIRTLDVPFPRQSLSALVFHPMHVCITPRAVIEPEHLDLGSPPRLGFCFLLGFLFLLEFLLLLLFLGFVLPLQSIHLFLRLLHRLEKSLQSCLLRGFQVL